MAKSSKKPSVAFLDLEFDEYFNRHGYLFPAYAELERIRSARAEGKSVDLARLKKAIGRATMGPPPRGSLCGVHRCHLHVLRGALHREQGDYRRAAELFLEGRREAERAGSRWGAWCAKREQARLARDQGDDSRATDSRKRP